MLALTASDFIPLLCKICLQQWNATVILTLVLLRSLFFLAIECGDNGHLLRASAIIAFTVSFFDNLSLITVGSTFNMIDKRCDMIHPRCSITSSSSYVGLRADLTLVTH